MGKLSARISMHVPEYSLKLSRPLAHHSAAFSIVVAGNQIAEFAAGCDPGTGVASRTDQLDLVPGGDQPDWSGNGGGTSQLYGGHG
jgi:hypothetical protein